MEFDPENSCIHVTNLVARLFFRSLQTSMGEHGVLAGQFPALLCLWKEEGLTQADLCRRLRIEQPTMANTLSRMERDGLIVRRADPSDGRRMRIFLTERAHGLRMPLVETALKVNDAATRDLSEEDRARFLHIARRMVENLDALGEGGQNDREAGQADREGEAATPGHPDRTEGAPA